jgi:hypothetical protein
MIIITYTYTHKDGRKATADGTYEAMVKALGNAEAVKVLDGSADPHWSRSKTHKNSVYIADLTVKGTILGTFEKEVRL